MNDLIAFLDARLDEDEAAANEVHRPRDCGSVDRDGDFDPDPVWCGCGRPDRERREVASKRLLLDWHKPVLVDGRNADGDELSSYQCMECDTGGVRDNWPCRTVLALAAVYSGHPDYRAEWATPAA